MVQTRVAFCDADIWINLTRADASQVIFGLYPQIYMAREVIIEINNFRGSDVPSKVLTKSVKNHKVKVVDIEHFDEIVKDLMRTHRQIYEHKVGFINHGKNLGEFASIQYAQELEIEVLLSDDRKARELLESEFDVIFRDHWDLLIEAEESYKLITLREAEAIHRVIESYKDFPDSRNYSLIKKLKKAAGIN